MAAPKKKRPEKKGAKTSPDTRSMRDVAEQKLADSQGNSSKLTGQTPEELIHELRVHQIELETQAEELRRIQQELEISRYKYLDLYDFAPVGYLTLNDKAVVTEANLTAATLLGVERRTLARARFRKYIAPADLDPWDQYFIYLIRQDKKQPCTLTLVRGDGSTFPARLECLRHTIEDGSIAIHVVISNISDIKKAQDALRESEEKFRLVVESAPDAIFIQTAGQFAYVNPAACRIFGAASPDRLIGKPVLDQFHPDFREIVKERTRRLNEERQPVARNEEILLRLDGTPVDVEVSAVPVTYTKKEGALVFVLDITDRKQAAGQRELLITELAQKNAELDRFTYTVSHDLKSPLIAIRGCLGLLEEDIQKKDPVQAQADITRISSAAEMMERLITTLLKLSRSGKSVDAPVRIPFTDLAREAAGLLATPLNEHRVTLVIPDNLPEMYGDRQRLQQVMTNLLDNAVKFMGDQKEPRIETGVRYEAGTQVFFVLDNGMGIRKENLQKVFGLFNRFNPNVPGTGIGLTTVKRIIEAHGGRIWVESEGEGKGTTVCFTLPGVPEKPAPIRIITDR